MKKLLSFILCAFILASVLTACGSNKQAAEEKPVLQTVDDTVIVASKESEPTEPASEEQPGNVDPEQFHNPHVKALPGLTELTDCICPVSFDRNGFKKENGIYKADFDVYFEEYFDAVEISLLRVGDTITINGDDEIEITSLKEEGGEIVINGGTDEGGFMLASAGGGTYKVRELDDMTSYSYVGKHSFELSDDVTLTDTADIENRCPEKIITGADEVVKHISENDYLSTTLFASHIRLEVGKVVEIKIVYVP